MSRVEWVRTALAVNHAGSITAGAKDRNLSQPAASQQIAALEKALGIELFVRHRSGVRATDDGARFLGQVAGPFDEIEWLLNGLDAGQVDVRHQPVTIGCQPEWFERVLLPRYDGTAPLRAHFGDDADLLDDVQSGRIDIAITQMSSNNRRLISQPCGATQFRLVTAQAFAPPHPLSDRAALAKWIGQTPWVGFSDELPLTRRFWSEIVGSLQPTTIALVAPDLRVVASAVVQGLGASLLPSDLCERALEQGDLIEVFPVGDLLPHHHRLLTTRRDSTNSAEVDHVVSAILEPGSQGARRIAGRRS